MKNTKSGIVPGSISLIFAGNDYKLALCMTIGMSLLITANAHALNWESEYGVNITAGYDDNFRLAATNELDTSFTKLGLSASAEGSSELTSLRLSAGINGDNYSDSSVDNRTTGNLSFLLNNRSERRQSNLQVSLQTEPTIETELVDSGVIVDGTRDRLYVSPGMSYQVSERNSLSINLVFTDVSYDTISLTEYQDNSLSLGWGYRLDETSDFSTSLIVSRYEPVSEASTDTGNLSLGYNISTSENTTYSLSAGYSDVDGSANQQTGATYSIGISNIRDERNSFSLTAVRSFQASGLGVVREEDRLGLSWTHGFSEKVQGVLSSSYVGTADRDYFEIQPSISYRLSENTSVSGNYRFRKQDSLAGDADSNSLLFTISYHP